MSAELPAVKIPVVPDYGAFKTPTPGRIVHYRLAPGDCRRIDDQRIGTSLHGNRPSPGDVVPLLVVRVWDHEFDPERSVGFYNASGDVEWTFPKSHYGINGQAFLDGNDTLWVTSAPQADANGCWDWPEGLPATSAASENVSVERVA